MSELTPFERAQLRQQIVSCGNAAAIAASEMIIEAFLGVRQACREHRLDEADAMRMLQPFVAALEQVVVERHAELAGALPKPIAGRIV